MALFAAERGGGMYPVECARIRNLAFRDASQCDLADAKSWQSDSDGAAADRMHIQYVVSSAYPTAVKKISDFVLLCSQRLAINSE
jgi:hypothetical protein